jgi:arabinogalactan oligomer / maltooligosaccharide transport system permease protein
MSDPRKSRISDDPPHWPLHLFVIFMVIVTVYPILWVLTIAFSGGQALAIADVPPNATLWQQVRAVIPWPEHISFENFRSLFADQPFARWLLNSVIAAGLTTFVGVFMSCTAAYAFSRFRFPGRRAGLMAFLVSQMFPGTLMLIPLFIVLVQWLNLGSSFTGLVLIYSVTAIPFCVWMMKGYFDTIPKELEESALIDGASQAMIFFRIVLPLAKPAVAVTALFSFMTGWNEYVQAATFMNREEMYTAPVGLRFFVAGFSQQWGYFAAGAIVAAIPVMLLFMFLQKYLVSGLTAGAVKG